MIYMTADGSETTREDRAGRLVEVQTSVDRSIETGLHERIEVFDEDGIRVYVQPRIMRRTPQFRSRNSL